MKLNVFLRMVILLVVLLALLVSMSGCLGVFEKSPEEVRQDFVDTYQRMDSATFSVDIEPGFQGNTSRELISGDYRNPEGMDYLRVSSEYRRYGAESEVRWSEEYRVELRDGNLSLRTGDENETVEGVSKRDLGSVYQVGFEDRSEWRFVSAEAEVENLLDSGVEAREGLGVYVDADDEQVARLLNQLQTMATGTEIHPVTADDIREKDVRLVKQEITHEPDYSIDIRVETKEGREINGTITFA